MTLTKLWTISILLVFLLFIFIKESEAQPIYTYSLQTNTIIQTYPLTGIEIYSKPNSIVPIIETIKRRRVVDEDYKMLGHCKLEYGCLNKGEREDE